MHLSGVLQHGLGHGGHAVLAVSAATEWAHAAEVGWLGAIDRRDLLVVEHDVRQPDVLGGHVQLGHSAVFVGIPFELVVLPFLQARPEAISSCPPEN